MIQVYTGSGKGKTSAALGAALRALGHGKRVLMIQFMKRTQGYGELKAAKSLRRFKILQFGNFGWVRKGDFSLKDKQLVQKGWRYAQEAIANKKFNLVILDELNIAVNFGLLRVEQIKETLKHKSPEVEVIITGRYAHPEIIKIAELVSEIKELKHYYKKGVAARAAIEY